MYLHAYDREEDDPMEVEDTCNADREAQEYAQNSSPMYHLISKSRTTGDF